MTWLRCWLGAGLEHEGGATKQMGLEVSNKRMPLSTAAVMAANIVLVTRMSQVGEGGKLGGKRRK